MAREGDVREIEFGDTEIGDLGMAVIGQQDVGRLNVAVYYSLGVRAIQRIRDFFREPECRLQRQFVGLR